MFGEYYIKVMLHIMGYSRNLLVIFILMLLNSAWEPHLLSDMSEKLRSISFSPKKYHKFESTPNSKGVLCGARKRFLEM